MHTAARKTSGIVGAAALVTGGVLGISTRHAPAVTHEATLTNGPGDGVALMLGPMGLDPNPTYMASAERMFLEPLGFSGHTEAVLTPSVFNGGYDWDATIAGGTTRLVNAVEEQIATGDFSADNPLWIFGYSQGTTVASQAMQQLADAGIASEDLHFVLAAHSASNYGGILNTFLPSLPDWLREPARQILDWFHVGDILGATTPDDLYPTDVYTLSGDGWSDWPADIGADPSATLRAILGMFSIHLEYFGLTPEQLGAATVVHHDDLVDYHLIPDTDVDPLSALWHAALNVIDVPDWLTNLLPGI